MDTSKIGILFKQRFVEKLYKYKSWHERISLYQLSETAANYISFIDSIYSY